MSETESKNLCDTCQNAVECLGQGIFSTEFCSRWQPSRSLGLNEPDDKE